MPKNARFFLVKRSRHISKEEECLIVRKVFNNVLASQQYNQQRFE